jgi:hypothetical protein
MWGEYEYGRRGRWWVEGASPHCPWPNRETEGNVISVPIRKWKASGAEDTNTMSVPSRPASVEDAEWRGTAVPVYNVDAKKQT